MKADKDANSKFVWDKVEVTLRDGLTMTEGTFLSRADVARMRQTWLSSPTPAQGGYPKFDQLNVV